MSITLPTDEDVAVLIDKARPVKVRPGVARLLLILSAASGRTLTYGYIEQAMFDCGIHRMTDDSLRTTVKHARQALRQLDWGVEIETTSTIGLRLTGAVSN